MPARPLFTRRAGRGFSILGALVAVAITSVIMLAAATLQRDVLRIDQLMRGSLTMQQEVRKAFKDFTAALRITTNAATGAYPLAAAGTTSITFYADVDNNGVAERYRYFLNGTALQRGVISGPTGNPSTYNGANEVVTTVVTNVANGSTPIFQYYDSSYDGTSAALTQPVAASAVRLVSITLVVDPNGSRPPNAQTFTTQVMLRTLKDNL